MISMLVFFGACLLSIMLVAWAWYASQASPGGVVSRLPSLMGACLCLGSFVFGAWVVFAPGEYLLSDLGVLKDILPGVTGQMMKGLGLEGLTGVLSILGALVELRAWMLIALIPTPDLLIRLVLLLAGVAGVVGLIGLPVTLLAPVPVRRRAGCVQAIICGAAGLLLLLEMPALDALGSEANLPVRFVLVLAGARAGISVWIAWLGLALLTSGGLIAWFGGLDGAGAEDGLAIPGGGD